MTARLKPGQVRDAIVAYLRRRGSEATMAEIIAAVNEDIGHEVAGSSVRSYLRLNTGSLFRRVERGSYRLEK